MKTSIPAGKRLLFWRIHFVLLLGCVVYGIGTQVDEYMNASDSLPFSSGVSPLSDSFALLLYIGAMCGLWVHACRSGHLWRSVLATFGSQA